MKSLLLLFVAAVPVFAQPASVGLKLGVPLTDFIGNVGSLDRLTHSKRYVIGGQAELRLPFGLGIEFDALYRRLSRSGQNGSNTTVTTTGNAWEFPLLLKYRFPAPVVRPYISGGVAWDSLSGVKHFVSNTFGTTTTSLDPKVNKGFVLGAGLDVKVGIRLQPELRYTRWGANNFFEPGSFFKFNQNQAEVLLGITF